MRRREEEFFEEGAHVLHSCVGGFRVFACDVYDEGQLVDEFVFLPMLGWRREAAEEVDHVGAGAARGPDVAVDYPDYVAWRGEVTGAHVADFGVGAELVVVGRGVFVFDEDFGIEGWEIVEESEEDGVGGVGA